MGAAIIPAQAGQGVDIRQAAGKAPAGQVCSWEMHRWVPVPVAPPPEPVSPPFQQASPHPHHLPFCEMEHPLWMGQGSLFKGDDLLACCSRQEEIRRERKR